MFRSLSFKIGMLFLVFIFMIEALLFLILYTNLTNDRIDEVMESLLARGNTHRDVLEDHFDYPTIEHVRMMEAESEFIVIITDENGTIITSSDPVAQEMNDIIEHIDYGNVPTSGEIVEDQWKEVNYISTDSPITIDGEHKGHVFMFAHSDYVQKIVADIGRQFLAVIIITIVLSMITIFILSKLITNPLIKMKEATSQLSKGNHKVALHTERKDELGELANSITKLSKDLKQMKQDRNEFLASVAHELRTPLTYIKGYADIINRPDLPKEEIDTYAVIIQEEADQLNRLVKDLFQLAKMDENTFVIRQEDVRLCDILQHVQNRQPFVLKEKEITLQIECEEGITAFIDEDRIEQVLIILLQNAAAHAKEQSDIVLAVTETENSTIISVADEGKGIPEKDLPYIFDRLYRVDKSRSRASGGSGLGLAIAKEIVEAHDGTIDIASELGKGTTVTIQIPRRETIE
ncbi:MAG TPA: ATP-binding protein [Pseudogracilibacillus sp.]|nr:ATP-binding protein [Pseudogracilibacillus sp.]